VGLPARKADRVYTYRDYRSWPEDERWELIHGVAWNMSPAPSVNHQRLILLLSRIIGDYLEGRGCELLVAPLDVFMGRRASGAHRTGSSRSSLPIPRGRT